MWQHQSPNLILASYPNFKGNYLTNTAVAWPFHILCQDKEEADGCSFYMTWPETDIFFSCHLWASTRLRREKRERDGGRACELGVEGKEKEIQKGALKRGPFLPAVNFAGHKMIYSHQRGQTKAVQQRTGCRNEQGKEVERKTERQRERQDTTVYLENSPEEGWHCYIYISMMQQNN